MNRFLAIIALSMLLSFAFADDYRTDQAVFITASGDIRIRKCAGIVDGKFKISKQDNPFQYHYIPVNTIACWSWLTFEKCKTEPDESLIRIKAVLEKLPDDSKEKAALEAITPKLHDVIAWNEKTKNCISEKNLFHLYKASQDFNEKVKGLTAVQRNEAFKKYSETYKHRGIFLLKHMRLQDVFGDEKRGYNISFHSEDSNISIYLTSNSVNLNVDATKLQKGTQYVIIFDGTITYINSVRNKENAIIPNISMTANGEMEIFERTPLDE